ncbi:MAG TPA: amidohydrolase [Chitinophagaceae bacterium]|nr:amidohydrolase [Chitinophagaceae bacterium]
MRKTLIVITCLFFPVWILTAQKTTGLAATKLKALTELQQQYDTYKDIALSVWQYAEVGYKETKSAALLQATLQKNGFTVQSGVAGLPTAFVATFGNGQPVIGLLAEFDALPGLSQDTVPERKPLANTNAGHACGHHLFGAASVAAAIELKQLMQRGAIKGTIKLFGCPAEEGGSGKVYMVREGLFSNVDAVVHWHPASTNSTAIGSSLADITVKFRFHGVAAHAAAAPDKGRSALDGVEAMDNMVNLMREHLPQDARIHYVISNGGKAPNVVPDFAEVWYTIRHPSRTELKRIFSWVVEAAKGAAMGTQTSVDYEILSGEYETLPNKALAMAVQKNLEAVGGVQYTAAEAAFATAIQQGFGYKVPPVTAAATIEPLLLENINTVFYASTDVGDISWTVPTIGMGAATWAPGTPPHSWQAVACGGTSIGFKGMMVAAKTMTLTALDLFTDKALLQNARKEFLAARGADFKYEAIVGDRKPPFNYRD